MGKTFTSIPEDKIEWIRKQEVFWVATAPLTGAGHVNVSPKGLRGSLRVEGPTRVWYEDLSGSGCETIAHLRENGRITLLFNAFEGVPDIVRIYGIGKVYELGTPEYDFYVKERLPGSRAVIVVDVHRVGTSCGWGIPYYKFEGHRRVLLDFARSLEKKDAKFEAQGEAYLLTSEFDRGDGNGNRNGSVETETEAAPAVKTAAPGGLKDWWRKMNAQSIDGLPAVERAGYVTDKPMGGVMPDPEKAGFKQRGRLDAVVCANGDAATHGTMDVDSDKLGDRLLASIPLRLRETVNVNAQLTTGILIGFLASFVLSDLAAFGRKYFATA